MKKLSVIFSLKNRFLSYFQHQLFCRIFYIDNFLPFPISARLSQNWGFCLIIKSVDVTHFQNCDFCRFLSRPLCPAPRNFPINFIILVVIIHNHLMCVSFLMCYYIITVIIRCKLVIMIVVDELISEQFSALLFRPVFRPLVLRVFRIPLIP